MPDYIYLLENRLSADQRHALDKLREAARDAGTILFLTGDAVRDLTSGHAVRELEVAIQVNALKLKKPLEKLGAKVWGEDEASRTLYLCFPGTVRVDLVSTHRVEYLKPGKPVYHQSSIQEDLRRRDFTANSMAISLNEGSFGLLMDPLNGAADIESRMLRLVSNYGFLEEPSLLIRATRYKARLSWDMDQRTQARYDYAKSENVIESLSPHARSLELEQIGHEEDGMKVLRALDAEGWMKVIFPAWTPAKADEEKLKALHDLAVELLMQGVHADMSAAQTQLLTAKLAPKDLNALKKSMLRPGFVEEWNNLDAIAAGFAKVLLAKQNATPSAGFKQFTSYDPEAVLWLGFTSKAAAVRERYEQFLKVWPEARQRIPHALMQEMRITPELPGYRELTQAIFLQLIDGKLTTPEEMRAYLEPHSPPAPPPPVSVKRTRAKRGAEARIKERELEEDDEAEEALSGDDDLDDIGGDEDEIDLGIGGNRLDEEAGDDSEGEDAEDGEEEEAPRTKASSKKAAAQPKAAKATAKAPAKSAAPKAEPAAKAARAATKSEAKKTIAPAQAVKPEAKKPAVLVPAGKSAAVPVAKPASTVKADHAAKSSAKPLVPVKTAPAAKTPAKPAAPVKAVVKKPAVPAKAAKPVAKPVAKKAAAKSAAKAAPAKPAKGKTQAAKPAKGTRPAKPAVKKPAPKAALKKKKR
jgi:tRNA nucleotidyltransferase (CCA-adding enzyme)